MFLSIPEAEYALVKRKYIIPLKLRKDYKPDGWLGIIGAGRYFFDFSREELYESKRIALLSKIRKAFNATAKNPMDGQVVNPAFTHCSRRKGTGGIHIYIRAYARSGTRTHARKHAYMHTYQGSLFSELTLHYNVHTEILALRVTFLQAAYSCADQHVSEHHKKCTVSD